jgi:CRISPR system Cascade subunit CasA
MTYEPRTDSTPERAPAEQLVAWLTTLVRNREYGELAQLRRTGLDTTAHIRAGWFDDERREVFGEVAFLFAVYHRGMSQPSYGYGSLGAAARRIGGGAGRGPDDPGAARLVDRIVASRRIPWRHLQHTVTRLRACEQPPPSWTKLVEDLSNWHDRKSRIAYGWAVDFHEPPAKSAAKSAAKSTARKPASGTATTQKDATQ